MASPEQPQKSHTPNGNQKLLVGLIAGLLLGLLIAFYILDYFPVISSALINVLIALFLLSMLGLVAFTWFKDRILAKVFGKDFKEENTKEELQELYQTISQEYVGKLLEKFPKATQDKAQLATPRLLKLAVWAFTRTWALRLLVAIFVAIGGLLGAILLYNQNQLLTAQNDKIDIQNEKIEMQNDRLNLQNNLIEADRRSSLVFLMSNILDKVDEEIQEQKKGLPKDKFGNVPDSIKFRLSKPLISRIVALSRAFRPYRLLEGDTLSENVVSLERGQLFIALMENDLDSLTQNTIVENGDFSNAVVGKINLKNANLWRANLSEANFSEANLIGINLKGADLHGANLDEAKLSEANLNEANLIGVSLIGADLRYSDLRYSDLIGADLRGAYLSEADLRGAKLIETNFRGADLRGVDTKGANFRGANLRETDLSETDLEGTDLRDTDLSKAYLIEANLSEAYLEGANLIGTDLRRADFSDANLSYANFQGANLSNTYLRGADLLGADLRNADLRNADLRRANLQQARISTEDFKSVTSLYGIKNMNADSMAILQLIRPCLFTVKGCRKTTLKQ